MGRVLLLFWWASSEFVMLLFTVPSALILIETDIRLAELPEFRPFKLFLPS